ncbi:MAG: 30S ribosomal protein S15 [Gammaproteobacteria bacterium]|nr:30S ribosomal protein S15 [Gammaproteobacteria bacterium]
MTAIDKQKIIQESQREKNDTGSPEVVVSLLTHRIKQLTEHLKSNNNDKHTRFGMMKLISQRKRLLKYLKGTSQDRYSVLIKKLGLRR